MFKYVYQLGFDQLGFMRHVYNGTDFINYVLCEICTTKMFVICVLYFVRNDNQWKFDQNAKYFIHEIASKGIVCEMAAILSRRRWVNSNKSTPGPTFTNMV